MGTKPLQYGGDGAGAIVGEDYGAVFLYLAIILTHLLSLMTLIPMGQDFGERRLTVVKKKDLYVCSHQVHWVHEWERRAPKRKIANYPYNFND